MKNVIVVVEKNIKNVVGKKLYKFKQERVQENVDKPAPNSRDSK